MTNQLSSPRTRYSIALGTALILLVMSAGTAIAHAVVFPGEAPTGAYQRYVLRVPNERGFATSQVSLTFPAGVRVISFDDVPGWIVEAVSNDGGASFASATWTGEIPVARFVEFGFIGVNPTEATTLKWDVIQVYADGLEVAWTGPADSATPASLTSVRALDGVAMDGGSSSGLGIPLGAAALLVALLALGIALRPAKAI